MDRTAPFAEVVEAAGRLTLEEREALVEILTRRMIQERRAEMARDIAEARQEFQADACQPMSPGDIVNHRCVLIN